MTSEIVEELVSMFACVRMFVCAGVGGGCLRGNVRA